MADNLFLSHQLLVSLLELVLKLRQYGLEVSIRDEPDEIVIPVILSGQGHVRGKYFYTRAGYRVTVEDDKGARVNCELGILAGTFSILFYWSRKSWKVLQ